MGTTKTPQDQVMDAVEEEVLIPGFKSTKVKNIHHCAECTTKFKPSRQNNRYCSPKCKSAFNGREASRGAVLYRAMQHAKAYEKEHPEATSNPYQEYADRLMQGWLIEDMQTGRAPSVRPIV